MITAPVSILNCLLWHDGQVAQVSDFEIFSFLYMDFFVFGILKRWVFSGFDILTGNHKKRTGGHLDPGHTRQRTAFRLSAPWKFILPEKLDAVQKNCVRGISARCCLSPNETTGSIIYIYIYIYRIVYVLQYTIIISRTSIYHIIQHIIIFIIQTQYNNTATQRIQYNHISIVIHQQAHSNHPQNIQHNDIITEDSKHI